MGVICASYGITLNGREWEGIMKQSYGNIILMLTIFAAIVVAGCTSPSPSPATATPAAGNLTIKSLVNYSNLRWYDYNVSAIMMGMGTIGEDVRADFGVNYNGTKANRYNETAQMVFNNNTTTTASVIYMNPSTGDTLGGHTKIMMNGNVTESDMPAMKNMGMGSQDPILSSGNNSLTSAGSESVTVPAGTYMAAKYTWKDATGTGTIWIAPNVPVPVKMLYSIQGIAMEMDLEGWG